MIKKTLLTFTLLLFSQACFAVDMQELNTEFFAKFVSIRLAEKQNDND